MILTRFAILKEPLTTKVVNRSLIIGKNMNIAKLIQIATRAPKSAGSLFAIDLFVGGNIEVATRRPPRISRKMKEVH